MMEHAMTDEILNEKNSKIKKSHNKLLIGVFILFVFSYFIFFTSNQWMPPAKKDINITPIGSTIEGNNRKITLVAWDYCRNKNEMEIILDMQNLSTDGINNYKFTIVDRNKGIMKCESIIQEEDFFVLHVPDVPRKFSEVSLRINDIRDDSDFATMKIYSSIDNVNNVNEIETLSLNEYQIKSCDKKIEITSKEIEKNLSKIKAENQIIKNGNEQIAKIKGAEKYQTTQEKIESLESINKLDIEIKNSEAKIQDYEDEILALNEKIEMEKAKKETFR